MRGFFRLLAASDVHGNRERMDRIIKYLNEEDVDAGVFLGDMTEYKSFYEADRKFYPESLKAATKPFLTTIGNHDTGNNDEIGSSFASTKELYEAWMAPSIKYAGPGTTHNGEDCYYYTDFPKQGVRIIVLNQYDHNDRKADATHYLHRRNHEMYSQRQIDFYINALETLPEGYGVITCLHNSPGTMLPFNMGYSSEHTYGFMVPSYISESIIPFITDGFINGTKAGKNFEIPTLGSQGQLTADFDFTRRGAGEFICYLGGHYHNSMLSRVKDYPNQLMYNVDSAGCDATTLQYSHFQRDESEEHMDSFAHITIDRARKIVSIKKIGTTLDEYGAVRLETKFLYQRCR